MDKIVKIMRGGARKDKNSSERLAYLDILKGIGIILVVTGHIYTNTIIFNWLYSFHMSLFFFVAGWVYKKKPVLLDLKRRFQTIVIPYFTFGVIILIYWAVLERHFRESSMGRFESFLGLLRGQYDYLDFNVHLWFLPCFFMTVVIYNVLVNINKRMAYGVVILMSVIFIIKPLPQLPWGLDWVLKYIGFYATGNILAEVHVDKLVIGLWKSDTGLSAPKLIGGMSIILIAINFMLSYFNLTTGIMWFVNGMIGLSGVAMLSLFIEHNEVIQYLGRISLVILCIHGPVYRVLIKVVSILFHMGTDAVRENIALALIVVVVTLVISAVVYEVLLRIAPWMIGRNNLKGKK